MSDTPLGGDLDTRVESIRLSRSLHDALWGDLTDLLIELEVTRHRQPSPELDRHVRTVREILVEVRRLVWELRQRESLDMIALDPATAPSSAYPPASAGTQG